MGRCLLSERHAAHEESVGTRNLHISAPFRVLIDCDRLIYADDAVIVSGAMRVSRRTFESPPALAKAVWGS